MNDFGDDLVPGGGSTDKPEPESEPMAEASIDLVAEAGNDVEVTVDETGWTLTSAVIRILHALSYLSPLPEGEERFFWTSVGRRSEQMVDGYVLVWIGVLVAAVFLADGDGGVVPAAIALYRLGDVAVFQALALLDRGGSRVWDARSTLVHAVFDLGAITLVFAAVARWQFAVTVASSLQEAFRVVTLRGGSYPGNWLDTVGVVVTATAILIFAGVIRALVSQESEHRG